MNTIFIIFAVLEALLLLLSTIVAVWASKTDRGLLVMVPIGWAVYGTVVLSLLLLLTIVAHDHISIGLH